jgi:Ca2+-binding RTX toxin-like protein
MSGKRIGAGTGMSLGALLALPAGAQADDFTVTNLNDSGAGSLRDALVEANGNPGADRVLFKSKLSGTIELGDRLEVYSTDLEIIGPGARKLTLDAGGDSRVLYASGITTFDLTLSGLTLTGGYASTGGAGIVFSGGGDLMVSRTTITDSHSLSSGGGIAAFGSESSLIVESSTISGNSAGGHGGGVYSQYVETSIRNSTISGNSTDGTGGGAVVRGFYTGPDFEVRNSTVTGNDAVVGGGLADMANDEASLLRGSIVAGNTDDLGTPDLEEGPWAMSFSLIGDTTGAGIEDNGNNLLDVDPKLKPLRNNGGPTNTHAFKKSPAKNAGPSEAPKSDQRGAKRKNPDIGAYELVKCEGVIVNRVGTAKKDKLKGTKRKDGILGLGGNDKLQGKKGKDGLCGGKGKDKLKGGPGKDKLDGGPGKDREVQ